MGKEYKGSSLWVSDCGSVKGGWGEVGDMWQEGVEGEIEEMNPICQ